MRTNKTLDTMKQFPAEFLSLVRRGTETHPNNIERAEEYVTNKLEDAEYYNEELEQALIRHAIRDLIYEARSTHNKRLKRSDPVTKKSTAKCKVDIGQSPIIKRMNQRWYTYNINGTTLGSVYGRDLRSLAEAERNIAGGHIANARLLEALIPLVRPDQTVKQTLTHKTLEKMARKYLAAA